MFAPVTHALIQDAQIIGNCAVLDVATGPGEPALSISEVVGPQGKVVGTDAVPEMRSGRNIDEGRWIQKTVANLRP